MLPAASSPLLALDRSLLLAEQGQVKWRAHVVDVHGNGVVLSWGFGQSLTRQLASGALAECGSFSVLVFAQGTKSFWLHQLYPSTQARWQEPAGRWQFGGTQIEAFRDLKAQVVIVRIDCELPGTRDRLTGMVEMGGVPRRVESGPSAPHPTGEDWSPLMGFGEGRAILQAGAHHHFHLQGRAYHERFGSSGLDSEGERFSGAGHFPFADRDLSFRFSLDAAGRGEAVGLEVDTEGRSRSFVGLRAEIEGSPTAVRTLTLWHGTDKWLEAKSEHVIHEGGTESHLVMRGRASMTLPTLGVVEWRHRDDAAYAQAKHFVHCVNKRPSLRTRLENGTTRDRWRRGLRWWLK